jgi:hypothetical protein
MPPNPAVNVRSNDLEATSPYWRNGLLPAHTPSGRPDLNRRPLDPQECIHKPTACAHVGLRRSTGAQESSLKPVGALPSRTRSHLRSHLGTQPNPDRHCPFAASDGGLSGAAASPPRPNIRYEMWPETSALVRQIRRREQSRPDTNRADHDHQMVHGCVVDGQAELMMAEAMEACRLQDHQRPGRMGQRIDAADGGASKAGGHSGPPWRPDSLH